MPVFIKNFNLTFVKGGLICTGIKMLSSVLSNESLLGPWVEKSTIDLTILIEPALFMPRPVSDDWVDEACDHDAVDDVSDEVTPLSQGPRHQGGSRGRENELEEPLGVLVL